MPFSDAQLKWSLTEAKANLSKLLDEVENGKEVIITRNGKPTARVERIGVKRGIVLGQFKGQYELPPDDTFQAMSDEEADAFLKGR